MAIKMKPGLDGFLLAMIGAVSLAWILPDPGARGGVLHPELLNKLGVALIFFLHGITLSFAALKSGTLRWPLHLIVQSATFVVFPLLGLLLLSIFGGFFDPDLRTGIFFLCALPSTVSSSVALTAAARGNVPAAVFNATLSSLLGVFITPFWLGIALGSSAQGFPVGKVVLELCEWLLLPLALGQLMRPLLGAFAARHKSQISRIDRGTILMLVYTSFCDSVKAGIWSHHGVLPLVLTLVLSLVLFFSVMG
ncbi:MAG TPA: bile acid:sodium symporter, partial [Polyangiales bacterium]|nr:bile acid:sodium symporter [Polyangiales bacterium]